MLSRNGQSTISHYICFKHGYTEDEMRQTGLKQTVSEDQMDRINQKDVFKEVKTKLFTNSNAATGEFPVNTNIMLIRAAIQRQKDLERKQNLWPGQDYKFVTNELFTRGPSNDANSRAKAAENKEKKKSQG